MNFTTLKTRVAEETGLDLSTDDTKIAAWVNEAYRFIAGIHEWPWLVKSATLQTVADITTGTATIAAGGTALTLSSGPAVSVANDYMIQFTGQSDDWYLITAHTAAATSATISPAFVGTSNYTSGAYILRKVYYSLASDCDRIIDMRQAVTDVKLKSVDVRDFDRILPDPSATGTPTYYFVSGMDSNNYWRITLYPIPSAVINIQYRYYQRITDLSSGSDTPLIPPNWQQAIIFVALSTYGHMFIDDTRVNLARQRATDVLKSMLGNNSPVPDKFPVMQPWDQRLRGHPGNIRFPSTFDQRWSV